MKKHKLFCIAYAGATTSIFYPWEGKIDDSIEIIPLELPGKGTRLKEIQLIDVDKVVSDLTRQILEYKITDYTLFGHSLGALLAFLTTQKLEKMDYPKPKQIICSAFRPPQILREKNISFLPDNLFLDELKKYGGTSIEVMNMIEWQETFLPIIKKDYQLFESYQHRTPVTPINIDLTVILGGKDVFTNNYLESEWRKLTTGVTNLIIFNNAGHFFIKDQFKELMDLLNDILLIETGTI